VLVDVAQHVLAGPVGDVVGVLHRDDVGDLAGLNE
jgi:hypothetical protein